MNNPSTKVLENKPYRPCVGIALFNEVGKVFVGERIDTPGAWQMPQGGIDPGEEILTAAFRELEEETGLGANNVNLIHIAPRTIRYDLPPGKLQSLWNGKYRGQEQTWVAMRFTGDEKHVNLKAHNPPEFSAWQWVNLEETIDLIVPFKRETYREIVAMFRSLDL